MPTIQFPQTMLDNIRKHNNARLVELDEAVQALKKAVQVVTFDDETRALHTRISQLERSADIVKRQLQNEAPSFYPETPPENVEEPVA